MGNLNALDTMKSYFRSQIIEQYEEEHGCDMASVHCTDEEKEAFVKEKYQGRDCYNLGADDDDDPSDPGSVFDGMTYDDGFMWNFQTCSILIFRAGQSVNSMFPPHKATWDELTKGCREQYGPEITPRPWELVEMWGFDDLVHKQTRPGFCSLTATKTCGVVGRTGRTYRTICSLSTLRTAPTTATCDTFCRPKTILKTSDGDTLKPSRF